MCLKKRVSFSGTNTVKLVVLAKLVINFMMEFLTLCLSGAVVSTSDYKSAGPSSIPDEDRRCTAHLNGLLDKYVPGEICVR